MGFSTLKIVILYGKLGIKRISEIFKNFQLMEYSKEFKAALSAFPGRERQTYFQIAEKG
jgi:hypothetical protein